MNRLLSLLTLLLLASPLPALAAEVLSIGDGDTITVQDNGARVKVRLACIDAPETSQAPYGLQARAALQSLLPIGSTVTLNTKATDRYGRTVAEVYRDNRNINLALVQEGQAFVYWQYISKCDRNAYSTAEGAARLQKLGVWSVAGGIQRPWDYRHGSRPQQSTRRSSSVSSSSVSTTTSGRYRCRDLTWNQAQQLLAQGHTYLDRDHDGEACESRR